MPLGCQLQVLPSVMRTHIHALEHTKINAKKGLHRRLGRLWFSGPARDGADS